MRREERNAKACRLRWVANDEEVELGPPSIPPLAPPAFEPTHVMSAVSGRFHIFLSQ